jgi:hypothetical protein
VIEGHAHVRGEASAIEGEHSIFEIERRHGALEHISPFADHADGIDHVLGRERAADHFRQHGLKDHVVLTGDHAHTQGAGLQPLQHLLGTIDASEASTDDGNVEVAGGSL